MSTNRLKGQWQKIKGELQKTLGNVMDKEWNSTRGQTTAVTGLVQSKYGHAKNEVQHKLAELYKKNSFSAPSDSGLEDPNRSTDSSDSFVNQLKKVKNSDEKKITEFY